MQTYWYRLSAMKNKKHRYWYWPKKAYQSISRYDF